MACGCSSQSLKASLLVGSILTWSLGISIFGLTLSTIKKPVFAPTVIPLVSTLYDSVVVALSGAVCICVLAVLGCCGAACQKPCLLLPYAAGLIILFVYQMVDGISLLYEKSENFAYLQFLSVDLCQYRKQPSRGRQGRYFNQNDVVESITRAEANARQFNKDVALLLEHQKAKGQAIDCSPIRDLLSPTAVLLFLTSALYLYLGFCSVKLVQNLWAKNKKPPPCARRLQMKPRRDLYSVSLWSNGSSTRSEKSFTSATSVNIILDGLRKSPGSPSITVHELSPINRHTPRRRNSSASFSNLYITPPMYFVPSIILCPPTP